MAQCITATEEALVVDLTDGRAITVPLAWFPRLAYGTQRERANWRRLDEDIRVESLLAGRMSDETQESLRRWLAGRKG